MVRVFKFIDYIYIIVISSGRLSTVQMDYDSVFPQPNNWFDANIKYEGLAKAFFSSPSGVVEGQLIVEFRDTGISTIILTIEEYHLTNFANYSRLQTFLLGEKYIDGDDLSFNGYSPNVCTRIEAEIEFPNKGSLKLSGSNVQIYDPFRHLIDFYFFGNDFSFTFIPNHLISLRPKYWVVPLINFLSDFETIPVGAKVTDAHPLRIFPTPKIDGDFTDDDLENMVTMANSRNHIITFRYKNEWGFIERLKDYLDRQQKLLDHSEKSLITAILVGSLENGDVDYLELSDWFPFGYLHLLGFTTGNEISYRWIEIRASDGTLLCRVHNNHIVAEFFRGKNLVTNTSMWSIGYILTQFFESTKITVMDRLALRQVFLNLVHCSLNYGNVVDNLGYVFRAVDILYEYHKEFLPIKPSPISRLTSAHQKVVEEILGDAEKDLVKVKQKATAQGERQNIQIIMDRVRQAALSNDGHFGYKMMALIEFFNFPDYKILSKNYVNYSIRKNGTSWEDDIAIIRNDFAHRGYLEEQDIQAVELLHHLYDLLARIVFTILEYEGKYVPAIRNNNFPKPVDWLNDSDPIEKLGYKKR